MDSWYADMANTGSSAEGGLIRSALFLRQFVTVPWVHLDIAGTACLPQGRAVGRPRRDRRVDGDAGRARPRRGAASGVEPARPGRRPRPRSVPPWGLAADRIGARWPVHEAELDESGADRSGRPAGSGRSTGGRPVVVVLGGVSLGALALRFDEPGPARDLRGLLRRPHAAPRHRPRPAAPARRRHPAGDPAGAAGRRRRAQPARPARRASRRRSSRRVAIPAFLFVVAIPFGAGAIGMGDLKLLVVGGAPDRPRAGRRRGRRGRPGGRRRARAAARGSPDHPPDLRALRAVPHRRRVLGGPGPLGDPVVRVARSRAGSRMRASRVVPRRAPSDGDAPAGRTPPWRAGNAPNGAPLAR